MKGRRLTTSRIAMMGMRSNRRSFWAMVAGIFMSIYIICLLAAALEGVYLATEADRIKAIGYGELYLMDDDMTDDELTATGWFDRIGHIYSVARLDKADEVYIGYFDAEGAALMNRTCVEGRLPQTAGEIALEQTALDALTYGTGIEIAVGDRLRLELTPIDGTPVEREYTLTGILIDYSSHVTVNIHAGDKSTIIPTAIVADNDTPFEDGRIARHRVMTFASPSGRQTAYDYLDQRSDHIAYTVTENGYRITYIIKNAMYRISEMRMLGESWGYIMIAVAAIVLCCTGIAQAMTNRIDTRVEQIGMLRAVGATKRQIRSIFGRETYIIAICALPLALAAAYMTVYALANAFPERLIFTVDMRVLAPVIVISALTIWLAGRAPLRRAANMPPMGVLRDSDLMRKARSFKPQRVFKPAWLISTRRLRIHPFKQVSVVLLLLALMISSTQLMTVAETYITELTTEPRLSVYGAYYSQGGDLFAVDPVDPLPPQVSFAELDAIAALNGVSGVSAMYTKDVNLILDGDINYIYTNDFTRYKNIWFTKTGTVADSEIGRSYTAAKRMLNISGEVVRFGLVVITKDIAELEEYVVDGVIDLKAINSGEEVLVYAPDMYYQNSGRHISMYFYKPARYDAAAINDVFYAGQTLDIMQLTGDYDEQYDLGAALNALSHAERSDYTPRVGAVLGGEINVDVVTGMNEPCIITTTDGARALGLTGLKFEALNARIALRGLDSNEAALVSRISSLTRRDGDMSFNNGIESYRASFGTLLGQMAVYGCIMLLLFASATSIITGGVRRSVNADRRMTGILRATGADAGTLRACYTTQIYAGTVAGFALMTALDIIGTLIIAWLFNGGMIAGALLASLKRCARYAAVALLLTAACRLSLGRTIKGVVNTGIIDNIREL